MNIEDFNKQLQDISAFLIQTRGDAVLLFSKELLSIIKLRLQQDRTDADGNSWGGYSQAVVPRWYYNKISTQSAKNALKKKGWFVSYEDAREANGLQTAAKDFTFSGAMLRQTVATLEEVYEGIATAVIKGSNPQAQDKLNYNSQREGRNIIEPSIDEVKKIEQLAINRINNALKNLF